MRSRGFKDTEYMDDGFGDCTASNTSFKEELQEAEGSQKRRVKKKDFKVDGQGYEKVSEEVGLKRGI